MLASILTNEMKNAGSFLSQSIAKEEEQEKQMKLYDELQKTTSLIIEEHDVLTILLIDLL